MHGSGAQTSGGTAVHRVMLGALAASLAAFFSGSLAAPALAQSAAPAPALGAEQAIQLFAEAGFTLEDGRPVNRCRGASTPRVAFIDLNGDGRAEAHVADVAPDCYGKPGAYFAILAQQADGTWKRLIAEDGIAGFEAGRSGGWNDLTLDARDSACPGVRRFNGTDYGAPTACSAPLAQASLEAAPAPATLIGTRADQIAQVLRNIVGAAQSRSWDAAIAAFPGAEWERRTTHAPDWLGSTNTQRGSIVIGGAVYGVNLSGNSARINEILFDSPGDDLMEWTPIAAALEGIGMDVRNVGCHSPTGFGWVRLTAGGHSAVLHKSVNYGTMVPSTDIYTFLFDDPFDGRTEAEAAADRSFC